MMYKFLFFLTGYIARRNVGIEGYVFSEYLLQPYSITRKFLGHVMVTAMTMDIEPR